LTRGRMRGMIPLIETFPGRLPSVGIGRVPFAE
jgi:hypothetical protein